MHHIIIMHTENFYRWRHTTVTSPLHKTFQVIHMVTVVDMEPLSNWLRIRPHTKKQKDAKMKYNKTKSQCKCHEMSCIYPSECHKLHLTFVWQLYKCNGTVTLNSYNSQLTATATNYRSLSETVRGSAYSTVRQIL